MRKCVLGRILVSYLLRNACLLRRMSDLLAMVDLLSSMNPLSSAVAWNRVTPEKGIYMLLGGAMIARCAITSGSSFLQFTKVLGIYTSDREEDLAF